MVYLQLFHGRKTPDEQMSGWGTEGPVLGPFPFVHSTYGTDIKVDSDAPIFLVDGLFYYDGAYYGDWSVISADHALGDPKLASRIEPFFYGKSVCATESIAA
jgi:hypothetical protein